MISLIVKLTFSKHFTLGEEWKQQKWPIFRRYLMKPVIVRGSPLPMNIRQKILHVILKHPTSRIESNYARPWICPSDEEFILLEVQVSIGEI